MGFHPPVNYVCINIYIYIIVLIVWFVVIVNHCLSTKQSILPIAYTRSIITHLHMYIWLKYNHINIYIYIYILYTDKCKHGGPKWMMGNHVIAHQGKQSSTAKAYVTWEATLVPQSMLYKA